MKVDKGSEVIMVDSGIIQCDPDEVNFDTKVDIHVLDDGSTGNPVMVEVRRITTISPKK